MIALIVGLVAFLVGWIVGQIAGWNDCKEAMEERDRMDKVLKRDRCKP